MRELIIASNNRHKLDEISKLLTDINLLTLEEIDFFEEISETGSTFRENALIKATAIYGKTKKAVLADDSGLEVAILGGDPGIFSSRYAGTGNSEDNIVKLLAALKDKEDRRAQFRTVLCYRNKHEIAYFEGLVSGKICEAPLGERGFGYDAIFLPDGSDKTFAQMTEVEKNKISHRAKALLKFKRYLGDIK